MGTHARPPKSRAQKRAEAAISFASSAARAVVDPETGELHPEVLAYMRAITEHCAELTQSVGETLVAEHGYGGKDLAELMTTAGYKMTKQTAHDKWTKKGKERISARNDRHRAARAARQIEEIAGRLVDLAAFRNRRKAAPAAAEESSRQAI